MDGLEGCYRCDGTGYWNECLTGGPCSDDGCSAECDCKERGKPYTYEEVWGINN